MQFSDLFYIDANGYHTSDYPTVLAWLTSAYQAIYGSDTQLTPDTKDGQWLAVQAQAFYDAGMLGQSVSNSFSPSTAQGVGLARVVKINGLTKRSATNSTVDLTITGTYGTTITNGIAQDTLNQQWDLPASVVIPSSGSIIATATAQNAGAVAAQANTVTTIFTPTNGWQTVNNVAAATVGQEVESDAELRAQQLTSTADPSSTVFDGTIGAVENVTGVLAVKGYENDTGTTDSNGIPAHSISIVASGGDSTAIAQAIQVHKGPGCGTYGTTTETVYDSRGIPSVINFFRPTIETITVVIHRTPLANYAAKYDTDIANAVAAAINALPINGTVYLSKLYSAANLPGLPEGDTFNITAIDICIVGGTPAASDIAIAFNQQAACVASVNVTVGT
jgi:uncharacterized phage protein gp47/JayE